MSSGAQRTLQTVSLCFPSVAVDYEDKLGQNRMNSNPLKRLNTPKSVQKEEKCTQSTGQDPTW